MQAVSMEGWERLLGSVTILQALWALVSVSGCTWDALTAAHLTACSSRARSALLTLYLAPSAVPHVPDTQETHVPPSGCCPPAVSPAWVLASAELLPASFKELLVHPPLPLLGACEVPSVSPWPPPTPSPASPGFHIVKGCPTSHVYRGAAISRRILGPEESTHPAVCPQPCWSFLSSLGLAPWKRLSTPTALGHPSSSLPQGEGLTPTSRAVTPGQLCSSCLSSSPTSNRVSKFFSACWAPGSRPRDLETPASQPPKYLVCYNLQPCPLRQGLRAFLLCPRVTHRAVGWWEPPPSGSGMVWPGPRRFLQGSCVKKF